MTTIYTIQVKPAVQVPLDGYVQFTFPSEYKDLPTNAVPCNAADVLTPAPVCTVTGNVLKAKFAASLEVGVSNAFKISLTNPRWESTLYYQAQTFGSSAQLLESQNFGISNTFTASNPYAVPLKAAKLTPGSDMTGETTTWTISLTTDLQLTDTSQIQVDFPYWNDALTTAAGEKVAMISTNTPTCLGTKGLGGTLTCKFATNSLIVTVPATAPGDLEFTVSQVKNLPTTATTTGFNIFAKLPQGVCQNSAGLTLSVKLASPNAIALKFSVYTGSPTTINSSTIFFVGMTLTNPLPKDAIIQFTFPPQLPVAPAQLTIIQGLYGVNLGYLSFSISGQTVQIKNCLPQYLSTNLVEMSLQSMTTPTSTQPTGPIIVTTTTSNADLIDRSSPGAQFTATAGSITATTIAPKNSLINAVTYYQFKFTVSNPVPAAGGLKITAPADVKLQNQQDGPCFQIYDGLLNLTSLCRVEQQKYIYISNCFLTGFIGTVAVNINGIANPPTIKPTDFFVIQTYTNSGNFQYVIDENGSAGRITATSDTLAAVEISPKSLVTGALTTYTFKVTTKNAILKGGYVTIKFPSDVIRNDVKTPCSIPVGYEPTFQCNSLISEITVTSGFLLSDFPPGLLSFDVPQIRNPLTTKRSDTFSVYTYTSTDLLYESLTAGIYVTMTTANQLLSVTLSPTSSVVSATADLIFFIKPNNPMVKNGVVIVTAPSEVTLPNPPDCMSAGTVTVSVSCSVISGQLNTQVTFASESTLSTFGFTLKNVKNPDSTRPTSSFKVTTTISTYLIDNLDTGVTYQVSVPNAITASVQPAKTGISEETAYTFTMSLKNKVPANGYITVQLPAQVTITSNKSCSFLGTNVQCDNMGGNAIKVNVFPATFNPAQLVFVIAGLKNNAVMGTSGAFRLTTKTNDDYLIDESADQTVTFTCSSPCLNCDTLASRCTSCVSASSQPYLYSFDCHDACQTGFVDLGDKSCVPCNSNCYTCFGAKTACTSCFLNGAMPYLSNSKCVDQCPPNAMVTTSFVCLVCNFSCKTCVDQPAKCTSCALPKLLYKNQCIDACPTAALLLAGTECLDCKPECATCAGSVEQCTSCPAGKLLYKSKCVDACMPEVTIVVGLQCQDCDPNCKTCAGKVAECMSCYPGSVLLNTQCVLQCPAAYTAINGVCQACIANCTSCSTSTDKCTGCSSGLFLHTSSCVSSCPIDTSVTSGSNCYDCDPNCVTCKGSVTNCVSCPAGKLLYQGKCVEACLKDVTVIVGAECFNCDSSCKSCSGSVTNCVSCYPGFSLLGGDCKAQCPTTHTAVNQVCEKCDASCLTCQGAVKACASCPAGLYLYQASCVQTCPVGVSVLAGVRCQECAATCKTCTKTADTCDTCVAGTYLLNGQCLTACPSKYLPVGGTCSPCDSSCLDCRGTPSTCLTCPAGKYLDSGMCVASCPGTKPIPAGQECRACETPCVTCTGSTTTCLTCNSTLLLLSSTCVATCPSGYYQDGSECVANTLATSACAANCTSELLHNSVCDQVCNYQACDYDSGDCLTSNSTLPLPGNSTLSKVGLFGGTIQYKEYPLPTSSVAVLSAAVVMTSKAFVKSTVLTTAIVSIWGIIETCSWGALCYFVYTSDNTHGYTRRLLESDDDQVFGLFVMLIVAFAVHAVINIIFTLYYTCTTCKRDSTHQKWREEHFIASFVLVLLSTVLSFKVIRLMYSGLFGVRVCITSFERKRTFFRPLLILTYLSLLCTTIPYICLCVFALVIYSSGNLVFIVALDTLSITILSLLVTVGDIIMMTHVVSIEGFNLNLTGVLPVQTTQVDTSYIGAEGQKVGPGSPHTSRSNEPFDKNLFIQEYFNGTEALPTNRMNEVSFDVDPDSKDNHDRCQSTYSAIEPEGEHFTTPARAETLETDHDFSDRFSMEFVAVLESAPPSSVKKPSPGTQGNSPKQVEESPRLLDESPRTASEHPLDLLIAEQLSGTTLGPRPDSTEDDELFNTGRGSESPSDSFVEELGVHAQEGFRDSLSQDIAEEPQLLDTIPEESALELDSAEIDEFDPECIKVPLKPSGIKVLVKKSFDGAMPVDSDGQTIPDAEPVSLSEFPDSLIEVDTKDVRFGTMRKTNSESRVRVKRSFSGAKVVDIEMTVKGEKRWLVGRTAAKPEEFDFSSAQADPYNPDSVIVAHRPSGHNVRVQKKESGETPSFLSKPHPREFMGGRILEVLPPTEPGSLMLYHIPVYSDTPRSKNAPMKPFQWTQSEMMSPVGRKTTKRRKIKSSNAKTRKNMRSRSSSRSSSVASREESSEKLHRIYGLENAGVSDDSGVVQVRPRKRKLPKRRFSSNQAPRKSIRNLEEIYLQRLEMHGHPSTTKKSDLRMPVFNPFFNSDDVDEDSLSRPSNSPAAQYLSTQRNPGEMGLEMLRSTPK